MVSRSMIKKLLIPAAQPAPFPIAPGLYHYMREAQLESYSPGTYTRFHLRVDPDGSGMLLANAAAAARLSPSGSMITKGLLDDLSEEEILAQLRRHFHGASRAMMMEDLEQVAALIAYLVAPGDNYPILNLEDAAVSPYEARLMAPLQADVQAVDPNSLVSIIDRLWQAAIPHVTILAPQNPDGNCLIRGVERAEDLGMIAGVRGRASDLHQKSLLTDLANAGVDYISIPYASADSGMHDAFLGLGDHVLTAPAFESIHSLEVTPVAEVPLLMGTMDGVESTITVLTQAGVTNINFYAIATPDDTNSGDINDALTASALPQIADSVEEWSDEHDLRILWLPPVLRDFNQPLENQVRLGPRSSGDVSVLIESDGNVIPPRGAHRPAGNLLTDNWTDIWNDKAFLKYRERVEKPTRCDECPGLAICAADCPRKTAGWSQGSGGEA